MTQAPTPFFVEIPPWPVFEPTPFRPWKSLQPLTGPVGVEIGFGDGRFLKALARENPTRLWVGIEVSGHAILKALRRVKREKLFNVMLLKGDARTLLVTRFAPGAIVEAYINFPDPWPKKRHNERRLVQEDFIRLLASRMAEGGELQIASDHPAVWEGMEALRDLEFFQEVPPREGPRTKYEEKWLRQGRPIRKLRLKLQRKVETPAVAEEALPMDHRILEKPALDNLSALNLGAVVNLESGLLKILRAYRGAEDGLILALVVDHRLGLRQTVLFDLHPYQDGRLLLGLVHTDQVLVSRAVLEALDWLADALSGPGF